MGVLKKINKMMTNEEIALSDAEYSEETKHLREVQALLAKNVQEIVIRVIKESGLSQNQMTKELGISSKTMSELVNGNGNPTLSTLAKIARISGMNIQMKLTKAN